MSRTDGLNTVGAAETRPLAWISVVVVALLCVLSAVYYRERMLFIDAPHNLFLIINEGRFHIEEHRYGSFVSQLLPFAGYKLHLPLRALMILYSVNFNLFFLAIMLLLVFRFRNFSLSLLYGFYLTMFVSATFFWPNNEVHQGMGWLLLAFAVVMQLSRNGSKNYILYPVFVLLFYLAIWTHPLIMLVCLYLWFFLLSGQIDWSFGRLQTALLTLILVVLSLIKFNTGMHHGYDSSKIEMVTHFQFKNVLAVFRSPQLRFFLDHLTGNYWLLLVVFVSGMVQLFRKKRIVLAILTLLAASGYLLLICITFADVQNNLFYMESEYMPLAVICSAPFVYFVLPVWNKRLSIAFLCLVFSVRIGYIVQAAPVFSGRVGLMEKIRVKMKEKHITKAAICGLDGVTESQLVMSWGAPVESIFISGLHRDQPQETFIFQTEDEIRGFHTEGKDTLLGCWEKRPFSKLNQDYFQPDRATKYQIINYRELMQ